ncbi:MAG: cupin domain-containing protein [Verrucomicrobia bacterium]|nr:cupin domain-containing protein [Verrucomicrobiota bacterium]
MNTPINLKEKSAKLDEYWSPRVLGELDDSYYAKIAKLKGSLAWHSHDEEDELFIVIDGQLKIEMKDQTVELSAGDMYIVPKGVMHNPIAEEECSVFIFEKKETKHTGNTETGKTRSIEEQLRSI